MKKMKTLSLLFLAVIMSSTGLVSCIDEDVDPVVESIYRNQALLLAAQAGLIDAEAAFQLAQADAENAQAELIRSNAAKIDAEAETIADGNAAARLIAEQALIKLVAETSLAAATAQNTLDKEQAIFDIALAGLIADLKEAQVALAAEYAINYKNLMDHANGLVLAKITADANIAKAEIMAEGMVDDYAITAMEANVAQAAYQVEWQQASVDALVAIIEDPNSLPAQVTAWKAEIQELEALSDLKDAEGDMKEQQANELLDGWDGEDDIREDFVEEYEGHVSDTTNWGIAIRAQELIISNAEEAIADYAGELADAEQAVVDATQGVADAGIAIETAEGVLGTPTAAPVAGDDPIAPSESLYDDLYNAQLDLADATKDHDDYEIAYNLLVETYNAAAVALAAAQTAYDGQTYDADLVTAQDALGVAEVAFAAAETAYNDAKVAYEADTNGSVDTDGAALAVSDMGELGLHNDDEDKTYMRVATWAETSIGSTVYVPATFYPTKYNETDLAVEMAAMVADDGTVDAANTNITALDEIIVWEQNGDANDGDGVAADGTPADASVTISNGDADLTAAQAVDAATDAVAYFVEIEVDDTSVTNLYTFNVATNMLGVNDFSTLEQDAETPIFILLTDDEASYDETPNADGESTGDQDQFTAYAALWNAQLEVKVRELAVETGDDALVAAQDVFDFQKELFDNGVANLATKAGAVSDADDALNGEDGAQDDVDNAVTALGSDEGTPTLVSDAFDNDPNTLYQELFNAELALLVAEDALATLEACDEACQQAAIEAAQHEIGLIQPKWDVAIAILAELKEEYDAIMEVYDDSGLDADLLAEYNQLMHEYVMLDLEQDAIDGRINYLEALVDDVDGTDLDDVRWTIETIYLADGPGSLADSLDDLAVAEAALAELKASQSDDEIYIAYLQGLSDTLASRIENTLALAAEMKALLEEVLQS